MPEALVATSWDDGCTDDPRLADLLAKYGVPGCFYVPRDNPERPVLDVPAIRELGSSHELGGHTLSHLPLSSLDDARAEREIRDGKRWLEDVLGRSTAVFCYPQGKFARKHTAMVQRAEYLGARTADWMCLSPGPDILRIAPSLHLYPHSPAVHVAHCARRGHGRELARYLTRFHAASRPSTLALAMLDFVEQHGGVFHLWGHAWELEQVGLWHELEIILRAIASRPALQRVTNAELAARLGGARVARP
jgi:peptidoglycan-N-acetylglucosamine deacetylase